MNWGDRQAMVRRWNADCAHQQMAGLASWAAFSARWRARQGLLLLTSNGCAISDSARFPQWER